MNLCKSEKIRVKPHGTRGSCLKVEDVVPHGMTVDRVTVRQKQPDIRSDRMGEQR
jgi:hypothetical protein